MRRSSRLGIGLGFVISMGSGVSNAAAQTDSYRTMAPASEYLMERNAEIRLARSAAPQSISRDATVLVLGAHGYEVAVRGTNGFVCIVGRSWTAAFDWPEFWNPKVRAADCMNPQAARFVMPMAVLRSRMVMADRSRAEIVSGVRAAFASGQLPNLESGAMDYMMSRWSYLTDAGGHNAAHVMFLTTGVNAHDWGANVAGSPVMAAPYWFFTSKDQSRMKALPPVVVFLVGVADWADGTSAGAHSQ